jgi:hypothetical protein
MKLFIVSIFTLLLSSTLYASNGKNLFLKANCQKCHGIDKEYDPKNSKVKTLDDLKGWVSSCAENFDIRWFPQEHDKVIKYLNETHYQLKN